MKKIPVSVVVPMRNSATTISRTLDSLLKQKYPILEIIIIDNVSSDNSIEVVNSYKKRSKITIKLIKREKNLGVGSSYNYGMRAAKSHLVIFMHSDAELSLSDELDKLVKPLLDRKDCVASYPSVLLPQSVWETYNFWEKCLFARAVNSESPGMNGKFDCIRKEVFLKIGGFDENTFGKDEAIGGEDADLFLRLDKEGKIIHSDAKVIHLHYLGNDYSLLDWIKNRKLLARTYGRLLRFHAKSLPLSTKGKAIQIPLGAFIFLARPIMAILPFLPLLHEFGIAILIIYAFIVTPKMFLYSSTLKNPRIFVLPFINIFFVYYESFWMVESFLYLRKRV